jgi:hypothetical protein
MQKWHVLAVCAALLLFGVSLAMAHTAVSGFEYPWRCCSGQDCYEISQMDVEPVSGGWKIKETGEVWPLERVEEPPDGKYHRCSVAGDRGAKTLCLWIPPMGS